jgi:hypothetical protein
MFLDYLALGITLIGITLVFYTFIYIHDIPYQVAKRRNHPQAEAIHLACWLSLFTLHALWPLIFIWAVIKPYPLPVRITSATAQDPELVQRIAALEEELYRHKQLPLPRELETQP